MKIDDFVKAWKANPNRVHNIQLKHVFALWATDFHINDNKSIDFYYDKILTMSFIKFKELKQVRF